ncbi:MAG: hypothetical protein FJX74_01490 [Armatimonadetes bacterium]|nr:hypothetical protein [Armatimonadota bacterium]
MARWVPIAAAALASLWGARAVGQAVPPLLIDDFDGTPLPWHGLRRDGTVAHSGTQSGKWWNMPADTSASLTIQDARQWVRYNTLEMWVHSEVDNQAPFVILLQADNPQTPQPDYYFFRMQVTWTGWRFLFLPVTVLGHVGEPLGWEQVTELKLSAIGWNCNPKADTVLRLDDIYLSRNDLADVEALPVSHFEDDIDMWWGLKRSLVYAKEGEASGKWDVSDPSVQYAHNKAIPHDWSLYDEVRFWAYAPEATGATIKVIIFSAPNDDDAAGYFTTFDVGWKGWTELAFPWWRFQAWGDPVGWHKVDSVMLTARKWGLPDPPPDTLLYLDNMILRRQAADAPLLLIEDFERGGQAWSELRVTDAQTHGGVRAALLTNFEAHPFVQTSEVPPDWSDYDALGLWVYSERANNAPIKILVDSDSAATADETDCFMVTFPITWAGWRHVQLPRWRFRPWGAPLGWESVAGLTVAGAKFGLEPKADTVLCIDDIALERSPRVGLVVVEDFESGLWGWHGLTDSTQVFRSGSHGGQWRDWVQNPYIETQAVPHDWRSVRALQIWLHARDAEGATIRILAVSDNPGTTETDLYGMDVKVDWTGWRECVLPQADFAVGGSPRGWSEVDALVLRAGADPLPSPDAQIVVDDVALLYGELPVTPDAVAEP